MSLDPDTWSVAEKKTAFFTALAIAVGLKLWGTFGKVPWWAIGLVAFAGIFFEPEATASEDFPPADGGALEAFPSNAGDSGQ